MIEPKMEETTRVDPAVASFEKHAAEMAAGWSPEVRAYAVSLVAEIDFARRLRDFREAFHLSQRRMAEITGEDQGDISRLERRELNPSAERMNRILARLRAVIDEVTREAIPAPTPAVNGALTTARDAAAYLCAIYDERDTEFTMLKLQKLLYYGQGICLAVLGRPLFGEQIKAWAYGPVVPEIRYVYTDEGLLPRPEDLDLLEVDPQVRAILDRVYSEYGGYAAWALAMKTHEERPWAETPQNSVIDRDRIGAFFSERLAQGTAPLTSVP
jgi:uncharacterized phage-associated protein